MTLHIFEERYKLMINECIKNEKPFAVVLIRAGEEVGETPEPFDVGTAVIISDVERLPDGRMNVEAIGYQRVRIRHLRRYRPFLIGLVDEYPLEVNVDEATQQVLGKLQKRLEEHIGTLSEVLELPFVLREMPEDPIAVAYLAGVVLNLSEWDKQKLLEVPDVAALIRTEYELLGQEIELLKFMLYHEERWSDEPGVFSVN